MCWRLTEKSTDDIYHAAIIFENYPEGIHSSSMSFRSLFMVWKNGKIYYRRVIENDPHHIKITSCKIAPSSNGQIYLVLNYDFTPIYKDSFTDTDGMYKIVMPLTGHPHAQIEDFELLPIGNLKIKNGAASGPSPPVF